LGLVSVGVSAGVCFVAAAFDVAFGAAFVAIGIVVSGFGRGYERESYNSNVDADAECY